MARHNILLHVEIQREENISTNFYRGKYPIKFGILFIETYFQTIYFNVSMPIHNISFYYYIGIYNMKAIDTDKRINQCYW